MWLSSRIPAVAIVCGAVLIMTACGDERDPEPVNTFSTSTSERLELHPLVAPREPPEVSLLVGDQRLIPLLASAWTSPSGEYVETGLNPRSATVPRVTSETLVDGILIATTVDPIAAEITVYELSSDEGEPSLHRRYECSASSEHCSLVPGDNGLSLKFPVPETGRLVVLKLMYPGPTADAPANVASWAMRT